jgi:hypothetical protein
MSNSELLAGGGKTAEEYMLSTLPLDDVVQVWELGC